MTDKTREYIERQHKRIRLLEYRINQAIHFIGVNIGNPNRPRRFLDKAKDKLKPLPYISEREYQLILDEQQVSYLTELLMGNVKEIKEIRENVDRKNEFYSADYEPD